MHAQLGVGRQAEGRPQHRQGRAEEGPLDPRRPEEAEAADGVGQPQGLRREAAAELHAVAHDEVGRPAGGEGQDIARQRLGRRAREDAGIHVRVPLPWGERAQRRERRLHLRLQPREAGGEAAEPGRLDGGPEGGRAGEGDLVPGGGDRAGEGHLRVEVARRRVRREQDAHWAPPGASACGPGRSATVPGGAWNGNSVAHFLVE